MNWRDDAHATQVAFDELIERAEMSKPARSSRMPGGVWALAREIDKCPEHFPELLGLGRATRDPLEIAADERLDRAIRNSPRPL